MSQLIILEASRYGDLKLRATPWPQQKIEWSLQRSNAPLISHVHISIEHV
jgi:hypothetical protein